MWYCRRGMRFPTGHVWDIRAIGPSPQLEHMRPFHAHTAYSRENRWMSTNGWAISPLVHAVKNIFPHLNGARGCCICCCFLTVIQVGDFWTFCFREPRSGPVKKPNSSYCSGAFACGDGVRLSLFVWTTTRPFRCKMTLTVSYMGRSFWMAGIDCKFAIVLSWGTRNTFWWRR